jgi:hypothetical protein
MSLTPEYYLEWTSSLGMPLPAFGRHYPEFAEVSVRNACNL